MQGARHLVLAGRHAPAAAALAAIQALQAQGVTVQVAQADLRDAAALGALVAALERPLKGVVHCAVVTNAAQLGELPPLEIEKVELFFTLPQSWTYPEIQPPLIEKIKQEVKIS